MLLWPWPWPDDLHIPVCPADIPYMWKWTSYVEAFERYRLTDRRGLEETKTIIHATSRVVISQQLQLWRYCCHHTWQTITDCTSSIVKLSKQSEYVHCTGHYTSSSLKQSLPLLDTTRWPSPFRFHCIAASQASLIAPPNECWRTVGSHTHHHQLHGEVTVWHDHIIHIVESCPLTKLADDWLLHAECC